MVWLVWWQLYAKWQKSLPVTSFSNISITVTITYCVTCYLINSPTNLTRQRLSLIADVKAPRAWHRHTSCSTQVFTREIRWEPGSVNLTPNAVESVHGSSLFCSWPLSHSVLVICAGGGTSHKVDHVQTHPHPEDLSQTQLHPQNQECDSVSQVPLLLGIQNCDTLLTFLIHHSCAFNGEVGNTSSTWENLSNL